VLELAQLGVGLRGTRRLQEQLEQAAAHHRD
jgi:hypothetical protein